jgi:DNA-binding transcriptional LysR family regulator
MGASLDVQRIRLLLLRDDGESGSMIMNLEDMVDDRVLFLGVVQAGSFTAAAESLGVSTSYASRRVRALEARLGVRLLERTTRVVTPTELGRRYAERVGPLLEALADADAEAGDEAAAPSGLLRVALPLAFGLRHVQPLLTDFARAYPDVVLDVSYDDHTSDLLADRVDVAVRGGKLADSSFTARRLCGIRGQLVASPRYLEARGRPEHPSDLGDHEGLEYTAVRSMSQWMLRRDDEEQAVVPRVRVRCDSGDAVVGMALAGLGIAHQPCFLTHEHVAAGELEVVLPDWEGLRGAFWAMTPSHRYQTRKVRLFIDALVEGLAGLEPG